MTKIYSPEELNSFSRETLVAVILSMQDQLAQLNTNMERLIEQIAVSYTHLDVYKRQPIPDPKMK